MWLVEIIKKFEENISDHLANEKLTSELEGWSYCCQIQLNSPIAVGWVSDEKILIINGDGLFYFDVFTKQIIMSDYEKSIYDGISSDNLEFTIDSEAKAVKIFGMRGGNGNCLTSDMWKIDSVPLAWNITVMRLINLRTGIYGFLELKQNFYEGNFVQGFAKSGKHLMIAGDNGIDVYYRN